jgi:hypothetical protein
MPKQPDMRFDIDALFAHLTGNLGHELSDAKDWHFTFRSRDLDKLATIGESLSEEFDIELQEEVPTVEDGREFIGPPMLTAVIRGALSRNEVKSLAARFTELAERERIEYEGVLSYEPFDEEVMFGWLALDDAIWRMRHFSDLGLADGAPMPFVFAVTAADAEGLDSAAAALARGGYKSQDLDEPMLLVKVDGRNEEPELERHYRTVEKIIASSGGELLGVQFLEEESGDDRDED